MTGGGADVILAVGSQKAKISKVTQNAAKLKLDTKKLLGDRIVCIPGFALDKYRKLQRSHLSIFSINCMGGTMLNMLGLPFLSPFVNLYLSGEDFIKFLRTPHVYLKETLSYHGQKFDSKKTYQFPVAKLGDILLNMMHYKTFEKSVESWESRKTRINWDNLLVMTLTKKPEMLEQFDALPYDKKICFVPFKSDVDSAWYIPHLLTEKYPMYVHFIMQTARGNPFFYDPFDMLLYCKKTPLIEM